MLLETAKGYKTITKCRFVLLTNKTIIVIML